MSASASALAPQDLRMIHRPLPGGWTKIIVYTDGKLPWPRAGHLIELRRKLIKYGIGSEDTILVKGDILHDQHVLFEIETESPVAEVEFCLEFALTEGELELLTDAPPPEDRRDKQTFIHVPRHLRGLQAA